MKFNEIDNLSEEQVLELYDEVLETNDKSAVTYYTMHVMCTDGSLETGGIWCGSYWRENKASCAYNYWWSYKDETDTYAWYVWSLPCTNIGKTFKKFCCD